MKKNYIIWGLIIMIVLSIATLVATTFKSFRILNATESAEPTINDIEADIVETTTVEESFLIESIIVKDEDETGTTVEVTIDSNFNMELTEVETTTETTTTETKENIENEQPTSEKQTSIINADHYSCNLNEIYYTFPVREYTEEQKELIVRMLYCESGSTSWDCQVATCSAILNLIEHKNGDFSILDKTNVFSPASYYRYVTPMQMQYDVLDYVLSGHLIANIKYFRASYYHSFGTKMFAIDNVYFSK